MQWGDKLPRHAHVFYRILAELPNTYIAQQRSHLASQLPLFPSWVPEILRM